MATVALTVDNDVLNSWIGCNLHKIKASDYEPGRFTNAIEALQRRIE